MSSVELKTTLKDALNNNTANLFQMLNDLHISGQYKNIVVNELWIIANSYKSNEEKKLTLDRYFNTELTIHDNKHAEAMLCSA